MANPFSLPTYDVPIVEPTGFTNRTWYFFFQGLGVPVFGASKVAALPNNAPQGSRAFVTDATSTTFLASAVGGGANAVPVVYNGASWVIG